MRKHIRVIAATVILLLMATAFCGCSKQDEATATPIPTDTLAPTIVVTPAPTVEASPTPEATESASSDSSASSSSSSSSSSGVLKITMDGEAVKEAQERLKALGYLNKVTGYFGTDTERAVKEFQTNNGLDADGKIGPSTSKTLMSEDAKPAS